MNIETAVNNFVLGNGKNVPSQEVCEVLINNHPTINKFIKEAIQNKLQKISIMPYGNTLQCWSNPAVYGSCSTTVPILGSNGETILEVNFDRN